MNSSFSTFEKITNIYEVLESSKDRRSEAFPFYETGGTFTFFYILFWCAFVQIGPSLMRNRNAPDLRPLMMVMNGCTLTFCCFGIGLGLYYTNFGIDAIKCLPLSSKRDFNMSMQVTLAYFYFCKKIVDTLRIVITILRKKDFRITFLHKLSCIVELLMGYSIFIFYPGGVFFTSGLSEMFVHLLKAIYEVPRSVGSFFKSKLWWGHYVKYLDFIRHSFLIVHGLYFLWEYCEPPLFMKCLLIFQSALGVAVHLIERKRFAKKHSN